MHWLAHFFGFTAGDGNGSPYLFWSGIGGILERLLELVAIGGLLWRHNNCHQPRCWRLGRLPVAGTAFKVCRHHHPKPPGKDTIRERYHLYTGRRVGRG